MKNKKWYCDLLLAIVIVLITRSDHLPEKRIYSLDHRDNAVVSTDLYFNNKRMEFDMPELKSEPKSDYVLKSGYDFRNYGSSILSISGDRKFFLISTDFYIRCTYKLTVDGKRVASFSVTEYSIYEPSKDIFHYIGASCLYEIDHFYESDDHGETIKEVGFKYYPAGWLDDELLLVETTKDEKIYTEDQDAAVKIEEVLSIEVPYATAKAVSFSLKDFTLSPTDKFRPLKPWTSYSDTQTGIVGYFDPFYPFRQFLFIDYPKYGSVVTTLTDLKGEKTYDLYELAKEALPRDYVLGNSSFCGAMVDKDGRRMCYYCMQGYPKEILKYKPNDPVWRESYPPIPREEYVVFGLDFDTGKIEKYMTTDQIISEVKRLYGEQHKNVEILIRGFG
ncbi:MAG: hypothetical protein KBC08_00680, partial [Caldisericia bacterium]|nr:hypothetical protein [Caldisericia bacterium]